MPLETAVSLLPDVRLKLLAVMAVLIMALLATALLAGNCDPEGS